MKFLNLILITIIIVLSSCNSCERIEKNAELRDKYYDLIYPEDTTINGVVKSIATEKVKRMGDLLYSNSNNVIIQSDTTVFSVCIDKITFNVNDSVKVVIERVKQEGDFNDVKTTIYPTFGEPTYTYWTFTNLYWKEVYLDEVEKIE